jgi:hypothetical protein
MEKTKIRLSKPALFEAMGYQPHAGQLLVHKSRATRRVLACGARWGKTTCAAAEAVAALLEPRREALGWVVAPTYDLSRLVFDRVCGIFERKFAHRIRTLSQRDQSLTVINLGGGRSVLEAKSADNPASLLGEGLDFVIVDEAAQLKANVWSEHVSQRLLDRRGWALLISTPNGKNWFSKLHRLGQNGRDPAFESWNRPSWENPTLDRALIDAERKRLGDAAFGAQYGAEFIGADEDVCDLCHGPSPGVPSFHLLRDGQEPARCADCGLAVNEAGETIVRRFRSGASGVVYLVLGPRRLPETDLLTRRA